MRGLVCLCALSIVSAMADPIEGYWEGALTNKGQDCPIQVEFAKVDGKLTGSFSMPVYRWVDCPFDELELTGGKLRAVYDSTPPLVFEGSPQGRGKNVSIAGEWSVGTYRAPFSLRRAAKPDLPYAIEEVTFTNGEVTLAGAVYSPKAPGKHGAVVVLHGSGDNPRWHFVQPADWFARQGMVCLIFDKRGNGKSTGKWLDVGFNELADDGVAGLRMLQARDDVDPKRIGFWGISQAGWIMEAAAQRCADAAFFVSISGGTAIVEREGYWDYERVLRNNGYSDQDVADTIDMMRRYNAVIRTGEGYQEFLEWMQPMREKPYWMLLEWAPRPPTAINQQWYKRVMDFNPEPILRELNIPMLFLFGEADDSNPTAEGVEMLNRVKNETNKDITVRVYPGADHGIRVAAAPDAAFPFRVRPQAFWDDTAQWLNEKGINP
ncbi:MAG: alpha/beta fold hydrolase [Candidatus Hydrogenedentes bacterium]|nr:alpha/beta fold hydrolase [Candidatus Hydrogenedentota bacterium]